MAVNIYTNVTASVQYRQEEKRFGTAVMKEKEDDLALFLEMRKIDNDRENNFLLQNSDEFDDSLGSEPDNSSISKMASTMASEEPPPANGVLNSEDKSDFEWLLTPPDTPLFPSLEMESQKTVVGQIPVSNGHSTTTKPKIANPLVEPTSKSNSTSKRSVSSTSSKKPTPNASRSSTPTPRPTLPSTTKPSRSSRSTLPSTKPTVPLKRSSTPTKPTTRSSTPSTRPSILTAAPKSTSRSSTPTRKPSNPSSVKPGPTIKNTVPSRGSSPTVKPRPQKDNGPSSLRAERPSVPSARSSSTNGRQRRQSCSPSKAQNGNAYGNMRSMIAKSRGRADSSDDVNPVLMGTQMVERVVNMRKLAPPKQDDYLSNHNNNSSGKSSSSQESSGFGRSLSKKSFDMALRHMDIRRSIPCNLRSLMTNVPASSVYSVRSGPRKSTTVSVSDSPLATSSTPSSELSFNSNHPYLDGSEMEENDFGSEP